MALGGWSCATPLVEETSSAAPAGAREAASPGADGAALGAAEVALVGKSEAALAGGSEAALGGCPESALAGEDGATLAPAAGAACARWSGGASAPRRRSPPEVGASAACASADGPKSALGTAGEAVSRRWIGVATGGARPASDPDDAAPARLGPESGGVAPVGPAGAISPEAPAAAVSGGSSGGGAVRASSTGCVGAWSLVGAIAGCAALDVSGADAVRTGAAPSI
jgi:hypothetical protein